jgi:hypothetical protein
MRHAAPTKSSGMKYAKPLAATLVGAVAINSAGAAYGIQLFTELPPLASITIASSLTGSAFLPVYATPAYNTVTDELIEAPVIEKDKAAHSS